VNEQNLKERESPQIGKNKETCLHAKQVINLGNNRRLSVADLVYVRLCELDGLTCANWDNPELCKMCPTLRNKEFFMAMRERTGEVKIHA